MTYRICPFLARSRHLSRRVCSVHRLFFAYPCPSKMACLFRRYCSVHLLFRGSTCLCLWRARSDGRVLGTLWYFRESSHRCAPSVSRVYRSLWDGIESDTCLRLSLRRHAGYHHRILSPLCSRICRGDQSQEAHYKVLFRASFYHLSTLVSIFS